MAKREWKVEWRAVPKADGNERLGQAVKLLIERAVEAESRRREAAPRAATAMTSSEREEDTGP